MTESKNKFKEVTLLITHYSRSNSLERLLKGFRQLGITFGEIIVSDDCSKEPHLSHLRSMQEKYNFTLITSATNKGLANNLNKGEAAVKTPFTLYVQEDFIPMDVFPEHFADAMEFMAEDPELDIVRFYAYAPYPYLEPYKKGFSRMIYKPWFMDKNKIYNYSDHPHLRRSNFVDRFGKYTEGIKSDKTEYEMCLSFIQNKGKGLFYDKFDTLFKQENSAAEPSTVVRSNWRQSNHPFFAIVRLIYRQIKYNYDIHVNTKFKK